MILNLTRNIVNEDEDPITQFLGCETSKTKVRMDRVDGYSIEDEELVLIIGGNEYFFEYDELQLIKLENYFKILQTEIN
jgi:hypothetical protein